ncbi:hypothetical protein [Flavobacterium phragmitis]|uniref:Uncharacterized protein n=1 Tax=Flavobacterium phragmitis TaxID=739143 RepID=A0A1I1NNS0_9FLAO|nr:hypothetical protein [Flavobacterium phragmitis]SFC96413.1 hypothetical protein SAMN05216297_103260 [Flavobacterium phragmitis]
MNNNTLENYYKKAVKNKYEEIKDGDNFIYLNHPTRAKLNKFCWEIFETNKMHSDDLVAVNSLLGLPFDINTKNKFRQQTNQFRPIETFFKGETDPEKIDVVDLAAILVDYQPRPFAKFRKQFDPDELKLMDELRNTPFSNPKVSSENLIEEAKSGNYKNDVELFNELTNASLLDETRSSNDLIDEVKNEKSIEPQDTFDIEEPEEIQNQDSEPTQDEEQRPSSTPIDEKPKSDRWRYLGIAAIVLVGLGLITYFNLSKKECIQWSGDHYEEVSCDLKIQGIGTFNSPEPYDERIINLRRIKVSDTTIFFKNEKAIIWYAKVGDSIQYFNTHGMHPETGRALRPITPYIINKYVRK